MPSVIDARSRIGNVATPIKQSMKTVIIVRARAHLVGIRRRVIQRARSIVSTLIDYLADRFAAPRARSHGNVHNVAREEPRKLLRMVRIANARIKRRDYEDEERSLRDDFISRHINLPAR